jgi:autotransporter passenger strand-loop-strand repeat protein
MTTISNNEVLELNTTISSFEGIGNIPGLTGELITSGGTTLTSEPGVDIVFSVDVTAGGQMFVSSGGIASSTTVEGGLVSGVNSSGYMEIDNGGDASGTIVSSGGVLTVEPGGEADDTTVLAGGQMFLLSTAVANGVTISSGGYLDVDAGSAISAVVEAGGVLQLSSDSVARWTSTSPPSPSSSTA